MKSSSFTIPEIPTTEQTQLVEELLHIIQQQKDIIQKLEDEISRLKKHPTKPEIRPSVLEGETKPDNQSSETNSSQTTSPKRGKPKKKKTIDEDKVFLKKNFILVT